MEYYHSTDHQETMTLQDMIERDIKTADIDAIFKREGLNIGLHESITAALDGNANGTACFMVPQRTGFKPGAMHVQISPNTNHRPVQVGSTPACIDGQVINLESSGELANLSWLQNMNLQIVGATENTNPNLLVNPQTGTPISVQQKADSTTQTAPASSGKPVQYVATMVSSPSVQTLPQHGMYLATPNGIHYQYQNGNVVANSQRLPTTTVTDVAPAPQTEKSFPKPVYSYSCLIALALRNSKTGSLPVNEIYQFMTQTFPYFKTAPDGWKNSVRHNLSLNKCFEKVENPKSTTGSSRKGCLWSLNPNKVAKMMDEIAKCRKKDPSAIKRSMANPEELDLMEVGRRGSQPHSNMPEMSQNSYTVKAENPEMQAMDSQAESKMSSELFNGDLNGLGGHHGLNIDPAMSDLSVQNVWEEFTAEDLNLDVPISTSPFGSSNSSLLNMSNISSFLIASPSTFPNHSNTES